jgi:outer membrane protein OmpA-like peptidoglycan-associated protein
VTRIAQYLIAGILLLLPTGLVLLWSSAAASRLERAESSRSADPEVAVAASADEEYCSADLKKILRRVLTSCGLIGGSGGRGCKPVEARNVATMSGADFNALFVPMRERGGIVQFDKDSSALDAADQALVEKVFAERRGASYFLVVSRASPEGSTKHNRDLSKERAEAVLGHLQQKFQDPDLDEQVGLLWLGEEYAQLDESFCRWSRSGTSDECRPQDLNRSAFVAWIDCRL